MSKKLSKTIEELSTSIEVQKCIMTTAFRLAIQNSSEVEEVTRLLIEKVFQSLMNRLFSEDQYQDYPL